MADKPGLIASIRLRRAGPGSNADLDDLFDAEDEVGSAEPAAPTSRPWVIISVLQTFVASAVLYTGFHVYDLAPSYPLLLAVSAGVVLVRQAAVATREPRYPRTRDLVKVRWERFGGPLAPVEDDGLLEAVARWDRRLDWGSTDTDRFYRTIAWRLGEIADERLRQQYGLTRATDPVRSRELLGAELWDILHSPPARVPPPARVIQALRQVEAL